MLKAVIFDMDGVIYRGNTAIPGVPEEIRRLQKKMKVLFLTNNATKSRQDFVRHLSLFGIKADRKDIMTSSYGTARYISDNYGKGKRIFLVGEEGMREELKVQAGAVLVEGAGAQFVVAGLDRNISYAKLESAVQNILSGAKFILANSDPTYPTEKGVSPGSGAIAASIIYAIGKQPDVIIGKPSTYLIDELLREHKLKPKDAVFIGDRLEIDIAMANKAGMKSILVLSGIAKRKDVKKARRGEKPKLILNSAAEVGKALGI
jgi:4-nitrophenyl phosphatase